MLHSIAAMLLLALVPVSHAVVLPDTLAMPASVLLMPCPEPEKLCEVQIRSHQQLRISGVVKVPQGRTLRVLPGGQLLLLGGGTLDFDGGKVEAPSDEHIFGGDGHIRGLASAYPEWFADPIEPHVYPASALREAYAATVTSGTIRFNAATYISPFSAFASFQSPRSFLGAGRPLPDSDTAPTRLVGGTILAGEVRGIAALPAEHLGIDAGPYTSARYLGGEKGFGLALFGTREHPASGSVVRDVSVLTTGIRDQHSVIVEGQHELRIDGLWIWTLGGTHGLVLKSDRSSVHGLHCRGAANDCLIVKSDYATDRAGYAAFDDVSDVDIRYLAKPGDTGGILIDSSWDQVHDLRLRGIHEEGLSYGVQIFSSWFHHPARLSILDWHTINTRGTCLATSGVRDLTVDGFTCEWDGLAPAFYLDGTAIALRNGKLRAAAGVSDGILDRAANTAFRNIAASGVKGYLLRSAGDADGASLIASGVTSSDGGVLAPQPPESPTLRARLLTWTYQGKLAARIAWTALTTRFPHPYLLGTLSALLPGVILIALWLQRRRHRAPRPDHAAI